MAEENGRNTHKLTILARMALAVSSVMFAAAAGLFVWKTVAPAQETLVELPQADAAQEVFEISVRSQDGRLEWFDGEKWRDGGDISALQAEDPIGHGHPVQIEESAAFPAERIQEQIQYQGTGGRPSSGGSSSGGSSSGGETGGSDGQDISADAL